MQSKLIRPPKFTRVINRFKNGYERALTLMFDETGLSFSASWTDGSSAEGSFRWQEIREVYAHKIDCFLIDMICLDFSDGESMIGLDEDAQGWKELVEQLPKYLPGCESSEIWFHPVAIPAFKTNLRKIYSRTEST